MSRNIEIKARVESIEFLREAVAALATDGPVEIAQDDTFFSCPSGRLKLRMFSATGGELIFYRREDQPGPKESFYQRTPTTDPHGLRECLALAYGEAGRVAKHRSLYLIGRTRVHLDRVLDLGDFMELEVVLQEGEPADAGIREARSLMEQLGIAAERLVDTAYLDLLAGLPRRDE